MTKNLDTLRKDSEQAEAKAQQLMADKDDAIAKVRVRYTSRLRAATDAAAAAQKLLRDAEAAHALAARDDLDDEAKRRLAENLGLELP